MSADYVWPDRQDRADELTPVAEELVERIRTDDPTQLCLELLARFDWWQMAAVICLLAAQVDPGEPHELRVGWVRHRDVIANPRPVRLEPTETPAEELTSEQINTVVWDLHRRGRDNTEIGQRVGLDHRAVWKRIDRIRKAREQAAEGEPVPAGVAG